MQPPELTLGEKLQRFVRKWKSLIHDDIVTEQSSAQSFLNDLLRFYGVDLPPGKIFEQHPFKMKMPVNGELFSGKPAIEYSQKRMDLYIPEVCVWEMKGPAENLSDHIEQAFRYWVPMQTRYVVLCNFREFWVYDTSIKGGTREPKFTLKLEDLPANPDALIFLRGDEPYVELHSERVTRGIAADIGRVIDDKSLAAVDQQAARTQLTKFSLECVFAMFAEDTDLIPDASFTVAMEKAVKVSDLSPVYALFRDFDEQDPGRKFTPGVPYINGPLYDGDYPPLDLDQGMLVQFHRAAKDFNWEEVRPEVFGSIFEQALDKHKRHELGAHFTAHQDIMKVVGPTIVRPWQERINATKSHKDCEALVGRMQNYHILDPACGCGNFLYVAYRELKRLERALARRWELLHNQGLKRSDRRDAPPGPYFTIQQLHGIDKQEWASMLARVVLWIAEHLANRELDLGEQVLPLKDLSKNIIVADALFTDWFRPEDDGISELAIVGNPPFMGRHKMRLEIGDEYVDRLHKAYPNNRNADLVTYWYPKAIATLREGERAGFVSTNSIAQNESREASLDRIIDSGGTLVDCWKTYPWAGEAVVHVSIVCWIAQDYGGLQTLDGIEVSSISPYLSDKVDTSDASKIGKNMDLCFEGVKPGNTEFVISKETAIEIISRDADSAKVIKKLLIARDIARNQNQEPSRYVIDFFGFTETEAKLISGAFKFAQKYIYPARTSKQQRKTKKEIKEWWLFERTRPEMRAALSGLKRVLVIARVSPYLLFNFMDGDVIPDSRLKALAFSEYFHFGILQCAIHELWAWTRGATLKADLSYTNTTIFETFPFPMLDCKDPFEGEGGASVPLAKVEGNGQETASETLAPPGNYNPRIVPDTPEAKRVSEVAETLYTKRQAACKTLNLGLTKVYNLIKNKRGKGDPKDADYDVVSNLNENHRQRIIELRELHDQLNNSVCACYGWPEDTWRDENEVLKRLLELNLALSG